MYLICYTKTMIGSINGKIIFKNLKYIIVDVGGVGYKISVSLETLSENSKIGDEIFLWIHTIVREDALDLYGFVDPKELEFFEMLISVSGIGPKSGLAILGVANMETLKKAIATSDTSYLTKISGIGRKTAEKIVIELRDKMGEENKDISLQGEMDALEALKALGYSQNEARDALKQTISKDINSKIKEALKILGSK